MAGKTVSCRELYKSFGDTAVIRNVSFSLEAGQILALLGPSGCGKTTTLRLIAGFEHLDQGEIEIAGTVVADGRFHMPPEKRRVGMVFQDYAIFPHLSVMENVAFGLGKTAKDLERARYLLALVGLAGLEKQMPHELSGGQQQRVALARALALEPAVLLLDEPFSNLDTSLRAQVRQEVRDLLRQAQATAIFVTHDQEEALFLGDQVAVMRDGRIEQMGTPEEIFHQPQTRFVAEFLGQTDFVPGVVRTTGIETPLGILPQPVPLPPGTAVEVGVRADDVQLRPAENGNGRILSRRFIGIAHIYQIALNNGQKIQSLQPHTVNLPQDTRVQVTISTDHPLPCFYNGTAVSPANTKDTNNQSTP
ncbi:MAG: ABC transporter ATP-binding protein [Chloroflexi bacterium]|nr:MAG: ABC transporter ATP-binding protein [Chloroflexota bacterium]